MKTNFTLLCFDPGDKTAIVWWNVAADSMVKAELTDRDPSAWIQLYVDSIKDLTVFNDRVIAIEGWEHQPYKLGKGEAKAPKGYKQRGQKIADMIRTAQMRHNIRTLMFVPSEMSGIQSTDIDRLLKAKPEMHEMIIQAAGKRKKEQEHIRDAIRLALYASSWVRMRRQLMVN